MRKRREVLIVLRAVVIPSAAEGSLLHCRNMHASLVDRSARKISRFDRNDDTGVCCLLVTRSYSSLRSNPLDETATPRSSPISNPSSLCYNIINMIQYGYQRLISAQVEVSASDCQKLFFPCKADRGTGRLSKEDVMKQKRSPARDASLRRSRITHRGKL